jgi:PAS domain S-box-containing protein
MSPTSGAATDRRQEPATTDAPAGAAATVELLSAVAEHTVDAVVAVDRAGRITYLNPAARRRARVEGSAAAALLGRPFCDTCDPALAARVDGFFASRTPAHLDTDCPTWGGRIALEVVPFGNDAALVFMRSPRPRVSDERGHDHDASPDPRDADATRDLGRLRALFETMPDGVAVVGADGRVLDLSPAAVRSLGLSGAADARATVSAFAEVFELREPGPGGRVIPVADWPVSRALRGETVENLEVQLRRTDTGWSQRTNFSAVPVRDAAGRVVQAVVTLRDLTAREELHRRGRDARAAAQAAEARYRELVDSVDAIVWEYDWVARRFTFVNRRAEQILGYPLADWYTVPDFWPNLIHPDDRAAAAQVCLTETEAGRDHRIEYRAVTKDGRVVWMRDLVFVARDAGTGRVTALRGLMIDVTDRRRADAELERAYAALQESEAQYKAFFDLAAVGTTQTDPYSGRFLRVNPKYCEITGYAADELLRMSFADISHPDDRDRDVAAYRRMVDGEVPTYIREKRYVRRDGQVVWVQVSASLVRDPDGRPRFAIAIITDVTDRRRALDRLRDRETFHRTLEAAMPHLLFVLLDDGTTEYVNQPWVDFTGLTAEQCTAVGWSGFIHADDMPTALGAWVRSRATGEPAEFEVRYRGRDGGYRWFLTRAAPVRGPDGRVVKWVGTATDIDDRRRAEGQLRATEERFEAFISNSPALSWINDPAAEQIVYASRPWQQLIGPPGGVTEGRSLYEVFPAEQARQFLDEDRAVLTTRKSMETTSDVRRADGTTGTFLVQKFPIRDATGRWLVGGVAIDISDRVRAEAELTAAKEAAEASNAAKDQFLAVLSHELRTPLTPVLLTASALQLEPGLSDEVREMVGMIREQVDLEARLIDDLLDLTRIAKGKLVINYKLTNAHDVLRRVLDLVKPRAAEERLKLEASLEATDFCLRADPARLQQLFLNLLGNAIKFTPSGGRVRVRTWNAPDAHGALKVEVTDTGIGIDPDVLARLFIPFEQGEQTITRKFGGLGLGLTIGKAVAELHGGTLAAASAGSGRGATFTVTLPTLDHPSETCDGGAAPGARPRALPPSTAPAPVPSKGRILIVEDHLPTLAMLARLLGRLGYEVSAADNYADGLRHATTGRFDLLVSDIGLPERSGWDLLKELRRTEQETGRPPLQAIALSGYGTDDDIARSKAAGFVAHVVKPVDVTRLETLVGELVAR